jgi:dTDP-glucose pyrophosphorylase
MDALKVGRSIAFLRKRYRMTQRTLADCLHISDKAVSKWERGLAVPDVSLLGKLSVILDTDIESILEGNIASFDVRWNGVLTMEYPEGMEASTLIYDKPAVYLQLAYFMLAGVTDIHIQGKSSDIEWVKEHLDSGEPFGIALSYGEEKDRNDDITGMMQVHGLSFLYGKDLTKSFRRILYGAYSSCRLESYQGIPLGIQFDRASAMRQRTSLKLERGVVAFPIQSLQDLHTASSLIHLIQQAMNESIYSLPEVAYHRGLLCDVT